MYHVVFMSAAKEYCELYCVPVVNGRGAGDTKGLWVLLILCLGVTRAVAPSILCDLKLE